MIWAAVAALAVAGTALWFAFGWEIQILETTLLAAVLVHPWDPRPLRAPSPPPVAIVLTRWLVFRIMLLSVLVWLIGLTQPVITVSDIGFSWRDIILIGGGLFLIAKATHEIHREMEAREEGHEDAPAPNAFFWVIVQIIIIDMVFSLDSIITAIGMAQDLEIMVAAVVIACFVMYVSSGPVSKFVADHPTTKMLALAFLVLIGVALVADGFKFHIPRGYIYFAIVFALAVELFNVLARRNRRKVAR